MLKAIHASEDKTAAQQKAEPIVEKLEVLKFKEAAKKVRESIDETLTYYDFPRSHHHRIRTNNALERIHDGDPATNPGGWGFPGWPLSPDAVRGPVAPHRRNQVGPETLSEIWIYSENRNWNKHWKLARPFNQTGHCRKKRKIIDTTNFVCGTEAGETQAHREWGWMQNRLGRVVAR